MQFVEPSRQFVKDSIRLVKRCTKPDRKGNCFGVEILCFIPDIGIYVSLFYSLSVLLEVMNFIDSFKE